MLERRDNPRSGRLLVAITSLSGRTYPVGTTVRIVGTGGAVDAWVGSEWVPLRWWEFAEGGERRETGDQQELRS